MQDGELQIGLDAGLLDALPSALVVTDRDGDILLWNQAAERLYGYPREQMRGANVMRLFVPSQNLDEAAAIMQEVLAGKSWTGVFPVAHADGGTIWVRVTDAPVMHAGQVTAVVGLAEQVAGETAVPGQPSDAGLSDLARALAEIEGLRTAMKTRGAIEQAKGVVMVSLGIDADAAFEVLRRMSQQSNRKLADVANDVVRDASAGRGFTRTTAAAPR